MLRRERELSRAPGGDTKVCPYCAEVIKAAAIRCRYCQSDLPPSAEHPVAEHPVAEQPMVEQPVVERPVAGPVGTTTMTPRAVSTSSASSASSATTAGGPSRRVVLACVALATVLTVVFGLLAFRAWDRERDLDQAAAASQAVRASLPEKLHDVLSYDFQTFEDNRTKALAQLSPTFAEDYRSTLDTIEDAARQQRRSQDAKVVAVAVARASADKVTTLVFINRTTTTAGSDKQRILQDRANVTLVRQDGKWLIDDITFPTS